MGLFKVKDITNIWTFDVAEKSSALHLSCEAIWPISNRSMSMFYGFKCISHRKRLMWNVKKNCNIKS